MVDSKIRKQIIDLISDNFNATDLQGVYIAMGLDYDNLSSGGVQDRATELVGYLARRDRLPELMHELERVRPNLPWPDLAAVVSQGIRLHQIPFPQNPNFTGREEILQQVAETLNAGQTPVVTLTIAGLGGVGKTQLALAYCYARLDDYDLIYWLSADSEPGLGESMMALGRRLKLIAPNVTDQQLAVQAVQQFLSQTSQRWLLVYDNADQIEPRQVTPYLPRMGNGHVLITSRNPNYGGVGKVLELGLFTLDEAVEFLLQRRGAATGRAEVQRGSNEWQEAERLAEELGRFPLALEHAVAYVESKGSSYAAYHRLFTNRQAELWQRADRPEQYHATITTTWELAFDEVKKTPGALDLLNLCCFLDPKSIPLDLIGQITALKTPVEMQDVSSLQAVMADELALEDAIGALRRYSLIQRTKSVLTLHRLVQDVIRNRMGKARARIWLEVTIDLLIEAYEYDPHDMTTWSTCGDLLPHLAAATNTAADNLYETEQVAYLNNVAGVYLTAFGNFVVAQPYFERALTIREKALDFDPSNEMLIQYVATSLNNFGGFLQKMGDLSAARPYLERALALRQANQGPEHLETALSFSNLGTLLQKMGDLQAAQDYLEKDLAIRKKVLGYNHAGTAASFNNLGSLLFEMGDLSAARLHLERGLSIRESVLGLNHPDTANSLNNLGALMQASGDYEKAQKYLEDALSIKKRIWGAKHPDTALGISNLGHLMKSAGDLKAAKLNYRKALAIREEILGPDHPDTASSLNNLGMVNLALGDFSGAQNHLERALDIRKKVLGLNHPDTAQTYNNLGFLKNKMGDLPAAKLYFEQALTIWDKILGSNHPVTSQGVNNLGMVLQAMGDLAAARPYLERALAIREKGLGPSHPDIAGSLINIGSLLYSLGDFPEARPYFERALAIREKSLSPNHPDIAQGLNNLGMLMQAMGDFAAARSYLERALLIWEEALGSDHPSVADGLINLANLAYNEENYQESARLTRQALAIRKKKLGANHPDIISAQESLDVIEGKLQ